MVATPPATDCSAASPTFTVTIRVRSSLLPVFVAQTVKVPAVGAVKLNTRSVAEPFPPAWMYAQVSVPTERLLFHLLLAVDVHVRPSSVDTQLVISEPAAPLDASSVCHAASVKFHVSVFSPPVTTLLIFNLPSPASDATYLLEVATGLAMTLMGYSPTARAATSAAAMV